MEGMLLLRDALLSGSTYPPGGALGIICASVSPLWEASFSLKFTPWGSIFPIPAPMWAAAQTGRPVAEAMLPSLPPSRVSRRLPGILQLLPRQHTAEGMRPGCGPKGGLTPEPQPSVANLGWSLHNQ